MGKSTISMAIFNSYFDITRGYSHLITSHHNGMKLTDFTAARQVSVVDVSSSPSPTTCSVSFQNLRWPSLQPLASPPSSEKVAHMTWRWEGHFMVDLTWPKTYRWTTLEMGKVSYVFVFAGFDLCSIPIHIPYIDLFGGSPYVLWIKRIKLSKPFSTRSNWLRVLGRLWKAVNQTRNPLKHYGWYLGDNHHVTQGICSL